MQQQKSTEFSIKIQDQEFSFSIEQFKIRLKRPFGTSHSTTTERLNCLFKLKTQINNQIIHARGESGLPPKKPKCYLANYEDCQNFFNLFVQNLQKIQFDQNLNYSELVFQDIEQQNFKSFRNSQQIEDKIFIYLLHICDQSQKGTPEYKAGKSGLENCIFEAISISKNLHFTDLLEIDTSPNKYAFYTVSLNQDISEMIEDAKYGLQFTKFLKIKVDGNLQKCQEIFKALEHFGEKWSIDANSGWTVEISLEMLSILKPYQQKITMIEQPFPIEFIPGTIPEEDLKWKQVQELYNTEGLLIYADESISNSSDIEKFKDFVNGVNIKLEKAGGIRESIKSIQKAKALNLKLWQGVMVASALNNTVAASLLFFGELGDMDGALLVEPDNYIGGFDWDQGLVKLIKTPGFGVSDVQQQNNV